eukprot:2389676-Prymnesium_polylepis.1
MRERRAYRACCRWTAAKANSSAHAAEWSTPKWLCQIFSPVRGWDRKAAASCVSLRMPRGPHDDSK